MNYVEEKQIKDVKEKLDNIFLASDLMTLHQRINYLQYMKFVFSVWIQNNVDKKIIDSLVNQIVSSINIEFKTNYKFEENENCFILLDKIINDLNNKGNEIISKKISDKALERMVELIEKRF